MYENKKSYKTTKKPVLKAGEKEVEITTIEAPKPKETKTTQPSKWVIDAELTMEQYDGAIKLLESGMKPRKVAAHFGIHRSKIRLT